MPSPILFVALAVLLFSLVVAMFRVKEKYTDFDLPVYNTVDNDYLGINKPPSNMVYSPQDDNQPLHTFAQNRCAPDCCIGTENSGLSCDRGCVCLNAEQKRMLSTRGYNQTTDTSRSCPYAKL